MYKEVFCDPETFTLETRFDILGTRGATACYKINEETGKPEMKENVYTFNEGTDVTNIIPLDAQLLPNMEKTKIPAGSVLLPYHTDAKTFVDLKTEDDKTVRVSIDISKWPRLVNDIPEDECFENLLYAG